MTTKLSSLRVTSDLDGNRYVAGAKAMTAANQGLVTSANQAGVTVQTTQTKVNSAGDVWSRLSRQYVEGAGAAQRFQTAIRTLQRGIDTGNVSMEQAEMILDGLYRKLGLLANAEELAANGQNQLAAAVRSFNARASESVPVHQTVGRVGRQNSFIMQNLAFQVNDVVSGFAMGQKPMQIFAQQGGQIFQVMSMHEGGVGGALKSIMALLVRFAPILLPVVAVVGSLSVGIAALSSKLSEGHKRALNFGETFRGVVVTAWKAFTDQFGKAPGWLGEMWDGLGDLVADAVNSMIRAFAIFGVEVNRTLSTIGYVAQKTLAEQAVNPVVGFLNGVTNFLNSGGGSRKLTPEDIAKTNIPEWNPQPSAEDQALNTAADAQIAIINRTDYIGQIYANGLTPPKKTGRHAEPAFDREIRQTKERIAALKGEAQAIGLSAFDQEKLNKTIELENAAKRDAIGLTPERIKQIDAESSAYARAKTQLDALRGVYDTLKDAFTGFFSDMKKNLQEGQTFWEAFGNAASNVLNKIADKALDMAASGIFDLLWNGGGKSSGGGLGGIISGILGGLFGHNASGTDHWRGGMTWVGEEGPELVSLPTGSQIFSNQRSIAMASANDNMPVINFSPVYNINGSGLSRAELLAVMAANNENMLRRVPSIMRDAYRRAA